MGSVSLVFLKLMLLSTWHTFLIRGRPTAVVRVTFDHVGLVYVIL